MKNKKSRVAALIKEKINCFDLMQEFNLDATKQADGESYRTYSWTHEGSNPTSMQIWGDSWYCHSSKMSGDVISMYAWLKFKGDNAQAFKSLMHRLNIGTSDEQKEEYEKYVADMERLKKNVEQFHKNLEPKHRQYFYNRHISDKFIDAYKCGYDPYADRIIIPVWKSGNPIYYCARAFDDSKISKDYPKYKKPSLSFSSYRENEMYGEETLKRGNDTLWIAEGVFDFASLWEFGETVLCNATGMSNKHMLEVVRIAQDYKCVYVCFDNDKSGEDFAHKMAELLFKYGIPFKFVIIPNEYNGKKIKDISDAYCAGLFPDQLKQKHSYDGVKTLLKSHDTYDDLYEYIYPMAPYLKRKAKQSVKEFIEENYTGEDKKDLLKMLKRGKTQQEYAHEFIKAYQYDLWYYKDLGMFYQFNGKYWEPIDEIILRQSFQKMSDLRATEERAVFEKIRIQSADRVGAKPNTKPCLNVNNGTIYFDTSNVAECWKFKKSHSKEDYCTYCLGFDYDPNAKNPDYDEFLHKIFVNHPSGEENMIMRYHEYLGSIFIEKNVESKAIMWVGDGSNGKTKLNEIVEHMLDESLWCSIPLYSMSKEFRLQELIGKRVNFIHDPKSDTYESESTFKAIIDNNSISTNVKNHQPVTFIPIASVFIDANDMFHPQDKSDGWLRRFFGTTHYLYNTFTTNENDVNNVNVFMADKNIMDKICTPTGLSYVLNRALEGYTRIVMNGMKYSTIPTDRNADNDLKGAGNHLYVFACEFDFYFAIDRNSPAYEHDEITSTQLYELYSRWYPDKGYNMRFMLSKETFFKRIEKEFARAGRNIKKVRKSKSMVYLNLEK